VLAVVLLSKAAFAADVSVKLTAAEEDWLRSHPVVHIGVDPEFAPFEFTDAIGRYQGMAAEYVDLVSERLGIEFRVTPGLAWAEVVERAKRREIDVLPCVGITEERKQYFNYSTPYLGFPRVIITRRQSAVAGIDDLMHERVAIQRNSSHHGYLRDNTDIEPILYDTFREALYAVSEGNAGATIANLAVADYELRRLALTNLKIAAHVSSEVSPLAFAVRKDWPELVSILDKALADISDREVLAVRQMWVPVYVQGGLAAADTGEIGDMEEPREASEDRYRSLVEALRDVVFELSTDGRIRYVSPAAKQVLGYAPSELLGQPYAVLIHPDHLSNAHAIFAERMAGHGDRSETRIRKKDGSYCWVRSSSCPIVDAEGRVTGLCGVVSDITTEKRAESELRMRDHILGDVAASIQRLLVADGHWNDEINALLKHLGETAHTCRVYIFENEELETGELATSQRFEWASDVVVSQIDNPDLQQVPWQSSGMGRWQRLMEKGEVVCGRVADFPDEERAILAPQGIQSLAAVPIRVEQRWWGFIGFDDCIFERDWSSMEIDSLRVVANTLGVLFERREAEKALHESEARFRSLVERLPETMVYTADVDPEGSATYISPRVLELLGYTPKEWLRDPSLWAESIHPEDRQRVFEAADRCCKQEPLDEEYRMVRRDGETIWIRDQATVICSPTGTPLYVLGVAHNVTERRQEAEESKLAAVGRLCAGVSHEYNNLLMGIVGYAHHLKKHVRSGGHADSYADKIRQLSDQAAGVSRQLLDFTRKQSDEEEETMSVVSLLDEGLGTFGGLMGEDIHVTRTQVNDATVRVVPSRIQEVLLNLLLNATDAMPSGGEIRIETTVAVATQTVAERLHLEADRGYVVISIVDEGSGMSTETMERAFEPFFTTKPAGRGVGLGLPAALGTVRAHDGAIELESRLGVGTTVRVYLPTES